jgi:exodeoxyribonuclease VII large subunit
VGAARRLEEAARRLVARRPRRILEERSQRLDELLSRLARATTEAIAVRRERLEARAARLEAVSPLRVLGRGYSLTRRVAEPALLRDASGVRPGDEVETRLARGAFVSRVVSVEPEETEEA